MVADVFSMALSGVTAGIVRLNIQSPPPPSANVLFGFSVNFALILVSFGLLMGLYRGAFHLSYRRQYSLATRVYWLSLLVVLSSFYIFRIINFPRGFTFLFFLTLPAFFLAGRLILKRINAGLQKHGYGLQRVLMAGYAEDMEYLLERFSQYPELGYEVCGVVQPKRPVRRRGFAYGDKQYPMFGLKELNDVVLRQRIDCILVPSPAVLTNGFAAVRDVCRTNSIKLKVLSKEYDVLLNLSRVYDLAGITLYAPPRARKEWVSRTSKRIFDIVGSLLVLLLLCPLLLITSYLIFLESGFPILFTQQRGSVRGGKTFGFMKLRSMVPNADKLKPELMKFNETDGALFKMKNDPRVTRVGKFIRKYSLDELPQLFNVLKGDMSLVGPRPLPVKDFETPKESDEFWESIKDREKMKPGMTGLWQISGRSNIGFKEMVLLDLYYVENHSILFDLEILSDTIPVVLFGKGAY